MKVGMWLAFSALCVASGALKGANLSSVAAEDTVISSDASLAAHSSLEAVVDAENAECLEKGFDAETLDCRVCNMLALTLSLQQDENTSTDAAVAEAKQRATEDAVAQCQRCCTDVEAIDGLAHQQQYARVVLEVCTCKFGRLPKIANFVNQHASKHPRLEIEYINARMPHLLFYDEAGEKKEEVSIASWDEETISEFIEAKLKKVEEEPVEEAESAEEAVDKSNADDTNAKGDVEEVVDESDKAEESVEDDATTEEATEDDVVEVEVAADAQ